MYKYLMPILLLGSSANIYACGDTSAYRAMDYAGYILFSLFAISAFLVPISILLLSKAVNAARIILVSIIAITGIIVSVVIAAIDTHPYMVPGAIALAATSFFIPIAYLFTVSIKVYRSGNATPNN